MNESEFQTSSQRKSDKSTQSTATANHNTTKSPCTRCGTSHLIDITHYEFPKQKGLVFECMSCGNNSLRSNISDTERKRRLALVAADHLHINECQFCQRRFYSYNDYLTHLRDYHNSNKK